MDRTFISLAAAGREIGASAASVHAAAKRRGTCLGYHWRYADEMEPNYDN